jgi:hypothetical protein
MKRRIDKPDSCQCQFCRTYDRYVWAVVMECGCGCHSDTGENKPSGHDSLCCEFPNGHKCDNPYTDLRTASDYKKILDLMETQSNIFPLDLEHPEKDGKYSHLQAEIDSLIKEFGI